jgi:hypothetical protein
MVDLLVTSDGPSPQASFDQFVWQLRRRPVARWRDLLMAPVPYNLLVTLRPTLGRIATIGAGVGSATKS